MKYLSSESIRNQYELCPSGNHRLTMKEFGERGKRISLAKTSLKIIEFQMCE